MPEEPFPELPAALEPEGESAWSDEELFAAADAILAQPAFSLDQGSGIRDPGSELPADADAQAVRTPAPEAERKPGVSPEPSAEHRSEPTPESSAEHIPEPTPDLISEENPAPAAEPH